jgi:ribonuclease VapC
MSDIAVDTSAIVESMLEGPRGAWIDQTIATASVVWVAPIARVEAAMVMIGRFGWDRTIFDRYWQGLAMQEIPIDSFMGKLAVDAFELWGKGRAPARLNFGDCFSYALAKAHNLPLLCVGNDFSRTDLQML